MQGDAAAASCAAGVSGGGAFTVDVTREMGRCTAAFLSRFTYSCRFTCDSCADVPCHHFPALPHGASGQLCGVAGRRLQGLPMQGLPMLKIMFNLQQYAALNHAAGRCSQIESTMAPLLVECACAEKGRTIMSLAAFGGCSEASIGPAVRD